MKKLLKLKRENWDSKGTSLYEAKATSKCRNTTLSIFIGEATPKKWRVEVYLESNLLAPNSPVVDIKLSKMKYPTKDSCIAPAMLYAHEFVEKQKDKLIAKIDKEFSSSFKIINTVYNDAV